MEIVPSEEKAMAATSVSCLKNRMEEPGRLQSMEGVDRTQLSSHFNFHFPELEKEGPAPQGSCLDGSRTGELGGNSCVWGCTELEQTSADLAAATAVLLN